MTELREIKVIVADVTDIVTFTKQLYINHVQ